MSVGIDDAVADLHAFAADSIQIKERLMGCYNTKVLMISVDFRRAGINIMLQDESGITDTIQCPLKIGGMFHS
jgi:hypothetical protein